MTYKDATKNCIIVQEMDDLGIFEDYEQFSLRYDQLTLMLYIMQERRNPFSEWYDWIQTFPTDQSSQMIFYSEEELKWLGGSEVAALARGNKRVLLENYKLLTEYYPPMGKYSLQEFMETY